MVIEYDKRPDASVDEKLRSLVDSIMLALGEVGITTEAKSTSQDISTESLRATVIQLTEAVGSLSTSVAGHESRIDDLEGRWVAPSAPEEDGAYVLTVTVSEGTPEYSWELSH